MTDKNDKQATDPNAPLRPKFLPYSRVEGELGDRARNATRVLAASRVGVPQTIPFNEDDGEATIRALESSIRDGTLFDAPTLILGVQQIPRFRPDGDRARDLVNLIAKSSYQAEPGTRANRLCNDANKCDPTPISVEEIVAVIDPQYKPTPLMNPFRGITVSTGMASVMTYIAVTDKPQMGLAPNETPQQFLEAKRQENPNVDVVRANRAAFRACIKQPVAGPTSKPEDFPLDLQTCARVGSIAAIFNIAQNGEIFADKDPMNLVPTPNLPNAKTARAGDLPALK